MTKRHIVKIGLAALLMQTVTYASAQTHAQTAPLTPSAQITQVSPVIYPTASARAADVQSIDGMMNALYEVISGGVGEARNWNRMRSLFIPEARIMAIIPKKDGNDFALRILSLSDYIAQSGPRLIEVGFREKELKRKTEVWGEMAHVLSSYETLEEKDQAIKRGINSVQMMYDGNRWWIISLLFEAERSNLSLPKEMK
jgi:hypothetical protein